MCHCLRPCCPDLFRHLGVATGSESIPHPTSASTPFSALWGAGYRLRGADALLYTAGLLPSTVTREEAKDRMRTTLQKKTPPNTQRHSTPMSQGGREITGPGHRTADAPCKGPGLLHLPHCALLRTGSAFPSCTAQTHAHLSIILFDSCARLRSRKLDPSQLSQPPQHVRLGSAGARIILLGSGRPFIGAVFGASVASASGWSPVDAATQRAETGRERLWV